MKRCVASVGTFDGVHIGHSAVIDRVLSEAEARGMGSRLITFTNHPLSVIAPDRAPLWATSRAHTILRLEESGVDRVSEMTFTPQLAALTAADFLRLIHERYAVDVLVMGPDNTFGSDRLTTREAYVAAGREAGVDVLFVDEVVTPSGRRPSSSELRRIVSEGDLKAYEDLTRSMIVIDGTVERGKRNGTRLGFPTANIHVEDQQPLKEGVYTGWITFEDEDGDSGCYFGLLNVGRNPTFGPGNAVTYEFHIPGGNLGDLYGRYVRVRVMGYLRPDHRFDSLPALKRAIKADIDILGECLAYLCSDDPDMIGHLSVPTVRFLNRYLKRTSQKR